MTDRQQSVHPDDALLARLASIVDQIDPVPDLIDQLARSAFQLRSLDSELAELVDDSGLRDGRMAGVRGELDVRMLSFEATDFAVELQVTERGDRRFVLGQVIRGSATEVRVQTMSGADLVGVDDQGRFGFDLPGGPFRMHLSGPGRRPTTTGWVAI